ncbi:hypothetical protein BURKHO8Y_520148 [Burkholderia sp. 8Y]|nr:hypothetical protein BURKHO8Y_520148 [Burkholderia sp. 8Y]
MNDIVLAAGTSDTHESREEGMVELGEMGGEGGADAEEQRAAAMDRP